MSISTASKTIKRGKRKFYQIARLPRCTRISVIDCTHVKIPSPGEETAELFRNRKGYFSINVQTILVARVYINDAHIFRNCTLSYRFETGHFENGLLIGDRGYPLKPYLITPLLQANTEKESVFN
nr:unnamed protein product [Callosobruchus analis]